MLSPTGRCHTFDVDADGFVSGEGCVVLLLKRLPDAERDGDRILAVVRGTAANQDGSTVNIATPSEPAQIEVYRAALAVAGVDPATVGFVEAHGTGTPVGDPIEYASLAAVYGTDGPTRARFGEDELRPPAVDLGPAGLMKAILALQHGVVPQNLHFNQLARRDGRDRDGAVRPAGHHAVAAQRRPAAARCRLVVRHVRHQRARRARAGAQPTRRRRTPLQAPKTEPKLFPLSATSAEQLRVSAGRLADWLRAAG